MPNNEFIGRRVSVGLGVESTYGTEVAPTQWMRHTKLSLKRRITRITNNSAMGRNEEANDSAIVEQWAEGDLEGKVYDQSIGYLLYCIFGSLSTGANADGSGTVKDHTFTFSQANIAKSLTVSRLDGLTKRRHGMATVSELDIEIKPGDWAMVTASIKAKAGVTTTDTAAYTTEYPFTSKHVTVKLATNLAGLPGATAVSAKSIKLNIRREATPFYALGAVDPSAFETGSISVTGEMVLRYDSTTYEDLAFANTAQAVSIALKNTDVTIGTSANPGLVFTLPKARLDFDPSDDLDGIVEQTISLTGELDTTAGYLMQAALTNLKTGY